MVRGTITFFYKFSIIVVTSKNENTLFGWKGSFFRNGFNYVYGDDIL